MEHILIGIVVVAAFAVLIWQAHLHKGTLTALVTPAGTPTSPPPPPAAAPVVINNHVNAPPVSAGPVIAAAPAPAVPDPLSIVTRNAPAPSDQVAALGLPPNVSTVSVQELSDYNALPGNQQTFLKAHIASWADSSGKSNLGGAIITTRNLYAANPGLV